MSDTDVRSLGLLFAVWIGVGTAVFAIGVGVETMLWPSVGELIQAAGFIFILPSVSIASDITIALPRRKKYVVFSVVGAMMAVSAGWLYRNSPEGFNLLIHYAALVGAALATVVILILGGLALEKIGVFPEGET